MPHSPRTSRVLLFTALAAVAAIYVRFYLGPPREVYVIQSAVSELRPELVAERQPLVIQDRVYDALPLARDLLRFQCVHSRSRRGVHLSCLGLPLRTVARATFVSPKAHALPAREGKDDVFLVNAQPLRSPAPRETIGFRLRTSQVLVLPAHWEVSCGEGREAAAYGVDVIEAFDLIHLAMWPAARLWDRPRGADVRAPDGS